MVLQVDSDVTVISATPDEAKNGSSSAPETKPVTAKPAAILLRQRPGEDTRPLEVRVAVIGNVDSGKSTMVGVLTRSMLDDGRGSARSKVFKHHHEGETGRTSAIGQHNLCLGSEVCQPSIFLAAEFCSTEH
jgi:GTPase